MAKATLFAAALCMFICIAEITQTEAWFFWPPRSYPPVNPGTPPQSGTPPSQPSTAPPQISDAKVRKCYDDVGVQYRCMTEIMASFWLPTVAIESECCTIVDAFNKDCSGIVLFAPLQSPLLANALKNHCSNPTPPSA